jgi:hypothetical protein
VSNGGLMPQSEKTKEKLFKSMCGDKRQFDTLEDAERAVYEIMRDKGDDGLSPYKCHVCGHWHIGNHTGRRFRGDSEPNCACGHAASIHRAQPESGCRADSCACLAPLNIIYRTSIGQHRGAVRSMKRRYEFLVSQLPPEYIMRVYAGANTCKCPTCREWVKLEQEDAEAAG